MLVTITSPKFAWDLSRPVPFLEPVIFNERERNMLPSWLPILAIAAILFSAAIFALIQFQKNQQIQPQKTLSNEEEKYPYTKQETLLSDGEKAFYDVLSRAIEPDLKILVKVSLIDLIEIPKGTEKYQTWKNKVIQKHVDFVICKPIDLKVIAAIELDDKSHLSKKQIDRDIVKDKVFMAIKTPLIRIKAKSNYDKNELRSTFEKYIS